MRNLDKNKRSLVALNYLSTTQVTDTDGFKTGEVLVTYSSEIEFKGNVSGAKGNAYAEVFGTDIKYDKTLVITAKELKRWGFDENTVFFIDKAPEYNTDNMPLYDYKVKKIADSINEAVIALEKVR